MKISEKTSNTFENIRKKQPTLMKISEKTSNTYENIRKNRQHF